MRCDEAQCRVCLLWHGGLCYVIVGMVVMCV